MQNPRFSKYSAGAKFVQKTRPLTVLARKKGFVYGDVGRLKCGFEVRNSFTLGSDRNDTRLSVGFGGNSISRINRGSKGLSNVIVVLLSLVIVVIIVVNVVLWGYQMNQFDQERLHEDVKILQVATVNSSSPWFPTQSEFTVDVGNRVSGTYLNTQSIDGSYESFTETSVQSAGLNWWNTDYAYRRIVTVVNSGATALNVNYSVSLTLDTASMVLSGKLMSNGNDFRVLYKSGGSWAELNREVDSVNTSSTQVWFETQAQIPANSSDNNYYVYYGNPSAVNPPANKNNVYLWFDDFNRADKPDITTETSYQVKTGGGTWSIENGTLKNVGASGDPNKLIIAALGNATAAVDMLTKIDVTSFAGGDTSRMGLSCCMDTSPSRGSGYCGLFHNDNNSVGLLNDLRSWGSDAAYGWSLNTWYYMRFRVTDPASGLGLVKVWPVGAAEPNTWTLNASFGGGSARSFGEIGFAGSRASDTTYFDDIIVRYIANPEPSTSPAAEESQFTNRFEINSTFPIDLSTYPLSHIQTVEILMRYRSSDSGKNLYLNAYNWTSSTFSDSGFNLTSGQLPTTGWDNYAVNLTNQWNSYVNNNGTMYVKIFDKGSDTNQTVVDVDFAAVRVVANAVSFTFKNDGSYTSHLVALWIDNSTWHQRYEASVYINAGDTISYLRANVDLPEKPYTVKIITERGNTAVFSPD